LASSTREAHGLRSRWPTGFALKGITLRPILGPLQAHWFSSLLLLRPVSASLGSMVRSSTGGSDPVCGSRGLPRICRWCRLLPMTSAPTSSARPVRSARMRALRVRSARRSRWFAEWNDGMWTSTSAFRTLPRRHLAESASPPVHGRDRTCVRSCSPRWSVVGLQQPQVIPFLKDSLQSFD
jgi:hypothetical protein